MMIALILATAACAPAPINRPIKVGDVNTGPGSPEAVRRQLAGRWHLTSLTIFSATGQPTTVPADAELTYDEFGNLAIRGQLKNPGAGEAPPILHQNGRAVIDTTRKQLRLVDTGSDAINPPDVSDAISYDHVRLYEFSGNDLLLTTIDANGKKTATAKWRKVG
jgi:hypothetical protein